ncbi:unnamed protein product, partial [Symbiodinium natans]
ALEGIQGFLAMPALEKQCSELSPIEHMDAGSSEYSDLSTQEGGDYQQQTLADIFRWYGYKVQTNVYFYRSGDNWVMERDTGSLHSAREFADILKEKSKRDKSSKDGQKEMEQSVVEVEAAGTGCPMREVDIFIEPMETVPVLRWEPPAVVWFHKSSIMDFHSKAIVVVENATRLKPSPQQHLRLRDELWLP